MQSPTSTRRSTRTRGAAALGATVLALTLLTACSGGGAQPSSSATPTASATAQSRAAACGKVTAALRSSSALEDQVQKLQSDPKAAAAALRKLDRKLGSAVAGVSEPTVRAAATKTEQSFRSLADQVAAYAKDPSSLDTAKLQKTVTQLQVRGTTLSNLCS